MPTGWPGWLMAINSPGVSPALPTQSNCSFWKKKKHGKITKYIFPPFPCFFASRTFWKKAEKICLEWEWRVTGWRLHRRLQMNGPDKQKTNHTWGSSTGIRTAGSQRLCYRLKTAEETKKIDRNLKKSNRNKIRGEARAAPIGKGTGRFRSERNTACTACRVVAGRWWAVSTCSLSSKRLQLFILIFPWAFGRTARVYRDPLTCINFSLMRGARQPHIIIFKGGRSARNPGDAMPMFAFSGACRTGLGVRGSGLGGRYLIRAADRSG